MHAWVREDEVVLSDFHDSPANAAAAEPAPNIGQLAERCRGEIRSQSPRRSA